MSSEMLIDKLVRILKQKHIYDLNTLTETLNQMISLKKIH